MLWLWLWHQCTRAKEIRAHCTVTPCKMRLAQRSCDEHMTCAETAVDATCACHTPLVSICIAPACAAKGVHERSVLLPQLFVVFCVRHQTCSIVLDIWQQGLQVRDAAACRWHQPEALVALVTHPNVQPACTPHDAATALLHSAALCNFDNRCIKCWGIYADSVGESRSCKLICVRQQLVSAERTSLALGPALVQVQHIAQSPARQKSSIVIHEGVWNKMLLRVDLVHAV